MERRWKGRGPWVLMCALVLALGVFVAGCGGDDEESGGSSSSGQSSSGGGPDTIRVAILSDCEGAFGAFYEADIGGAQTVLIDKYGAKAKGKKPSDGLGPAKVAGKTVEIVGYGCSNDTADKAIEETRRLMEQEKADILIGPLSGDEGIAVANYAKDNPDKTFINGTSGAQDATLKVQAPNFFRFHSDGAQWAAGLGDYAYNKLGWKTAAVIGDDYSFPYTSLAGFIAEFCAVGGKVTKRIWPALGEKDYSSFISQIPKDVDGVMVGIGGSGLISFIKQYRQQRGDIDPKKIMGNNFWPDPLILKEIGAQINGAYTAQPTAPDSTEAAATEYVAKLDKAYGKAIADTASSVFTYNYYNAMQGLVSGLEQVKGDISGGQKALQQALAKTEVDGAYGKITLDDNRNGVADNYVAQIVKGDNGYTAKTIAKIPGVEQTFAGTFSSSTPAPDRTNPECKKGSAPPWVGKAESVSFGT
jgi:branched-chain amino acid transport system substrate-binding protein